MKVLKLLLILCISSFIVAACDDNDDTLSGEGTTGVVPQVAASFDQENMTVLKNAGEIQIPVVLADAAEGTVKLTVGVKGQTGIVAEEGIDFEIKEKVISIEKGNKIGYVPLVLFDNEKAGTDKSFVIEIKNVYGYGKKADTKQSCTIAIVNNAFVEFQYKDRETTEAAGKYRIPLLVTGEIKETTTVTLRVKEGGTALEGTHFKIANPQVTLEKGATNGEVEIQLTDDSEANADRWLDLEIVDIKGSNAIIGTGIPCCRVTIVSEEVLKSVFFSAAEYSVEEGDDLRIPIQLDKAPVSGEPDVVITLNVKTANSNATEGTDFTIEEKTITFVAGQKEDEVVIKTAANQEIKDLYFELAVKAAVGANLGTPDVCKVTITNKDVPTFEKVTYEVEEDAGVLNIPVTLPYTYTEDMLLKLEIIPSEGTEEGTHFTIVSKEINIPVGSKMANISLDIKHADVWNDPSLKIVVKSVNETVLRYEAATTLNITQCAFRKLLGDWAVIANNPDNCKGNTDAKISLVTWQKEVKVVMSAFWNNKDCYFNMTFDKETQKLKMILNQRVQADNWNFGGGNTNVGLRLLVDGQLDLTDIEMASYNVDNGIITFPIDKHIGGGGCNGNMTDRPTVWGFFWKNGTLTKKK